MDAKLTADILDRSARERTAQRERERVGVLTSLAQCLGRVHSPLSTSLAAFRDHLSSVIDADVSP